MMENRPRPPGPPPAAMSLDEFKPCPCERCGEPRRLPVGWIEHRRHRFQQKLLVAVQLQAFVCLGCRAQLSPEGIVLGPEHPDRLPEDVLEQLLK